MGAIGSVASRVALRVVDRRPTRAETLLGRLLLIAVPVWIVPLEPRRPWLIAFSAVAVLITVGAAAELSFDVPAGDWIDERSLRRLAAVVVLALLILANRHLPAALTTNVGMGIQLGAAVGVWSRLLLARWYPEVR